MGDELWENKTKGRGLELLEVANCAKVNIWGERMEDKDCSGRFAMTSYLSSVVQALLRRRLTAEKTGR